MTAYSSYTLVKRGEGENLRLLARFKHAHEYIKITAAGSEKIDRYTEFNAQSLAKEIERRGGADAPGLSLEVEVLARLEMLQPE